MAASKVSKGTGRTATRVVGTPDGIIRVFVDGPDDDGARSAARSLACKIHGGIAVGRTPVGVAKDGGHTYTFSPVTTVKPAAPKAAPKAAPEQGAGADLLATVLASLDPAAAEVIRAALSTAPKAKGAKATPREVPAFVQRRRELREAAACKTCLDFGKVRGPKAGAKAGMPFRTANGAATAPTAVPCPSCQRKGGRKGATA